MLEMVLPNLSVESLTPKEVIFGEVVFRRELFSLDKVLEVDSFVTF